MKTLKKIKHKLSSALIINCEEADLLIVKKNFQSISLIDQINLSMHLHFCKACRIYHHEIDFLHHQIQLEKHTPYEVTLSDEEKEQIQKLIVGYCK